MEKRLGRFIRYWLFLMALTVLALLPPLKASAAPYAAMVIDARSGEVLHSRNADTRLHPASLTKMMTLYVVFDAIKRGEISLDTKVKISSKAANEPPSKLGLRAGQRIKLRYLIRAAAIKSANDSATALGEAISGSEAAFARRMNRTAKALGMSRTTFKNAHGLTETGHMSTARDMTQMGRRLFYDFPDYYNLFSRLTADAGIREVAHTNRRFLNSYKGADGIKTGYTRAAGFNLVASAQHGKKRIITTVFGGRSTATRNARVTELMDLGFRRAPRNARVKRLAAPQFARVETAKVTDTPNNKPALGKTLRLIRAVKTSIRPLPRPTRTPDGPPAELLLAMQSDINNALQEVQKTPVEEPVVIAELTATTTRPMPRPSVAPEVVPSLVIAETLPSPEVEEIVKDVQLAEAVVEPPTTGPSPLPRPANLVLASVNTLETAFVADQPVVVTRLSTSGGHHWGINVGRFGSRYQAERVLLKTALRELGTLDDALRKVVRRPTGFDANFVGMTEEMAALACRRLSARSMKCSTFGP